MFKREKELLNELTRDKDVLFFIIVTLLSIMVRISGRNFVTGDYLAFMDWYDQLRAAGGLAGLSTNTSDYSVFFQTILALLTYIPLPIFYLLKVLFAVFDYALAGSAAAVVCHMLKEKKFGFKFNLIYTLVIFMPTVVVNAAFWGQCDSIYAFFCMLTLLYLYKGKYKTAFVLMGFAFAFKLQSVFILPFVVCYYIWKKDFSILHFFISAAVFWLSGIAVYLSGKGISAAVDQYAGQANMFPSMWMNFTSFWMVLGNSYRNFGPLAIFTTLTVCGVGLYAVMADIKTMNTGESYLNTCVWFMWAMLLFLPEMHERYSYILDILLVMLCFFDTKYIKFAVLSVFISLLSYSTFLVKGVSDVTVNHAMIYTGAWIWYSYMIVKKDMEAKKNAPAETAAEAPAADTVAEEVPVSAEPAAE